MESSNRIGSPISYFDTQQAGRQTNLSSKKKCDLDLKDVVALFGKKLHNFDSAIKQNVQEKKMHKEKIRLHRKKGKECQKEEKKLKQTREVMTSMQKELQKMQVK